MIPVSQFLELSKYFNEMGLPDDPIHTDGYCFICGADTVVMGGSLTNQGWVCRTHAALLEQWASGQFSQLHILARQPW